MLVFEPVSFGEEPLDVIFPELGLYIMSFTMFVYQKLKGFALTIRLG
jgi:hypothetical protein